jgi:putative DNA methylase
MTTIKSPKKLIEVALPLDAINEEAARSKRKAPAGYPTTLHSWWAQRPLAAARAVIFSQLVNDPASLWEFQNPGQKPSLQQRGGFTQRRKHLFQLISELVKWESTINEDVLKRARKEIRDSWREVCALNKDHPAAETLFNPEKMPGLHDPFAGGGSIPLEAQRLGLDVSASDLNPVAVLINKAMIEIPPRFTGRSPVHPAALEDRDNYGRIWKGATGLAEDVRHYGQWMRDRAYERIGHLYPVLDVTAGLVARRPELKSLIGQSVEIVAWLWARTVKSPNPAFSHVAVPLVSSYILSSKDGKESWVKPIVVGDRYRFEVRTGRPPEGSADGTKLGRGANFKCILSGTAIEPGHIYAEALAGRMGSKLMAIVAEGPRGRIYLDPDAHSEEVAASAEPTWEPDLKMPDNPRWFSPPLYGLASYGDLFTARQLVALTTFAGLIGEARETARNDAIARGLADDGLGLEQGGRAATAYGEAIGLYLAFSVSRVADYGSSVATWRPKDNAMRSSLGKQAIPMVWDYAEGAPFAKSSSGLSEAVHVVARVLDFLPSTPTPGLSQQSDAQSDNSSVGKFVSTDPPYYDNIGYADLSDFYYVWLRRSLRPIFPSLFVGIAVPKAEELVATPARHGSKELAEAFFLDGMTSAMHRLAEQAHPAAPVTIYYAFKQAETKVNSGTSSTGWETFLQAVLRAGFALTGTWPVRTEGDNRQVGNNTNALASSIVLVCRSRADAATTIARREFIRELDSVLPVALDEMTKGAGSDRSPVAPVDLSQAIIGPGMAVFSKYAAVLEADGTEMSVKTALQLINRFLAEDDFDRDTQFCLHWFDQYGWKEGAYGEADVLARAKATSVGGLKDAGVVDSEGGKVRLLRPAEYPADWDPSIDKRLPVWEALHHLVRAFRAEGESGAGKLLGVNAVQSKTEGIRQLAYRLYTLCERRGWADDARAYNELVSSWASVETVASAVPEPKSAQLILDLGGRK